MDSETAIIAFTSNGTGNPDAFIVTNISNSDQTIAVRVQGTTSGSFEAYRTTKSPGSDLDEIQEKYHYLGSMGVKNGVLVYDAPAGSVTTFFGE
jgi:hypothetical protein